MNQIYSNKIFNKEADNNKVTITCKTWYLFWYRYMLSKVKTLPVSQGFSVSALLTF